MSRPTFLRDLFKSNFLLMNLKSLYIESLRRRKDEEAMKRKFDDTGDKELSQQMGVYLKKTKLKIQILDDIIKYICINNKLDFDDIIHSMSMTLSTNKQEDIEESNDLSDVNSPSSYIVDVDISGESSNEVEFNTRKSVFHANLFTCDCGKSYDINIQPTAVDRYFTQDCRRTITHSPENHHRRKKERHQFESTLSSSGGAPTTVVSKFESVVEEPNMKVHEIPKIGKKHKKHHQRKSSSVLKKRRTTLE